MFRWQRTVITAAVGLIILGQACRSSQRSGVREVVASDDPFNLGIGTAKFEDLSFEGWIPDNKYPWAGAYWPFFTGGLASRWQTNAIPEETEEQAFKPYIYHVLTEEAVKALSKKKLAKLSPAEKYDILNERYDFPLTKSEWRRTLAMSNPKGTVPSWYGITSGWAQAAIIEPEPLRPITMKNSDNIEIKFYPFEIKALLSYLYAKEQTSKAVAAVAARCENFKHALDFDGYGKLIQPKCRMTNPAALHLMLGHYLGYFRPEYRQSFVIDLANDDQIWNHPVIGYKFFKRKERPVDPKDPATAQRAPGTTSVVTMITKIHFLVKGSPTTAPTQNEEYSTEETLYYNLELDKDRRIIGGEWGQSEVTPVLIWRLTGSGGFDDALIDYSQVQEMIALSRAKKK